MIRLNNGFHRTATMACMVVFACFVGSAAVDEAHAAVSSTFDTDADGWTAVGNGAGSIVYSPATGNPGGAVTITDVDNGYAYFQAPAKFLIPGAYNGQLSFDLSVSATGPDPIAFPVQVALEGNSLTLLLGLTNPTGSLVNYTFDLVETAGWRIVGSRNIVYSPGGTAPTQAQLQGVLDNLTGIYINADHTNGTTGTGTTEIATLDNVILTPEPSSLAMLGILAVAGARRARNGRRTA